MIPSRKENHTKELMDNINKTDYVIEKFSSMVKKV